ncbi:LPXTG cell wall anchor domain-containing protein [Patescibacteria group bacterium]
MRKALPVVLGLFFFGVTAVFAQTTLTVTSIGTVDTSDGVYTNYSYSSANPAISGTTVASEQVGITIDGVSEYVTADSLGVWTYVPTGLTEGSHDLIITSNNESIEFMISITETPTTTTVDDEATLPDTGIEDYTVFLALAGFMALIGAGVVAFK